MEVKKVLKAIDQLIGHRYDECRPTTPAMHTLQRQLLELARKKNLGSMTLREIGTEVGEKFPQKIKHHLDQLLKKGLIKIDKQSRVIEAVKEGREEHTNLYSVPILGFANCGPATLFAEEAVQGFLKVSSNFLSKKQGLYAVKAVGSSMNRSNVKGDNIEDGDYVLVEGENKNPRSGDYVLSVIDGAANIKKFISEKNRIALVSESNEDYPPIIIHPEDIKSFNYIINGKVVGVIKKPKL